MSLCVKEPTNTGAVPRFALHPLTACLLAASLCSWAHAGPLPALETNATIGPYPIRLSHWLAPHPTQAGQHAPYGLMWLADAEKPVQSALKSRLLERLRDTVRSPDVDEPDRLGLLAFAASLPVTGRIPLTHTDPRWLELHPESDPVLQPGQRLVLPPRPETVSIVRANGEICRVRHLATAYARDYLRQCAQHTAPQHAWIVQPDGIVQRHGIADWNQEKQAHPAPGAWIIATETDTPWHWSVLDHLAFFLATQGPAPDSTDTAPALPAHAPPIPRPAPRDLALTANDWGNIGLMQMSSARMAKAGEVSVGLSQTQPYTRLNFTLHPFDWMETSFRYMDVSNRLYGPAIAGDQSYKDKSIDIKLKLTAETRFLPQIAVGLRDLSGTGLFSGEYVVASKRTGNFDWTLGLGWGNVGGRGNLKNPLSFISSSFDTRPSETTWGKTNFSTLFRGPVALFGGVQYQTPLDSLILKLEYDGNDYQHEPQGNNQPQSTPFNLGAVYRYSPAVDVSFGLERGNTAMLGINLHAPIHTLYTDKLFDPPWPAISENYPDAPPDWSRTAQALERQSQWRVTDIRHAGSELIVRFDEADAGYWQDRLDRITAVLHRDAPKEILVFRIQSTDRGLKLKEYLIDRRAWLAAKTRLLPPGERQHAFFEKREEQGFVFPHESAVFHAQPEALKNRLGFNYSYQMGGPDGFILHQLSASAKSDWKLTERTWASGEIRARLLDNYDKFKYTAPSNLPRVRTYVREYLTTSQVTLANLQLTHVGRLGQDQFYSLYGGMLEDMYGGIGGEWLYRPLHSPVALGVDINTVRQRAFEQNLDFRDYQITTGHATLYWDTGFQNVQAKVSAGRYLAGDTGFTVDLSREFRNGVSMGAFASKTNVSAEEFGEGSFDKGIYVRIPFDVLLMRSSSSVGTFNWHPLLRDGAAKLERRHPLFDLTRAHSDKPLKLRPYGGQTSTQLEDVTASLSPRSHGVALLDRPLDSIVADDLRLLGKATTQPTFWGSVVAAGTVTLASSLLDKSADNLARDYGGRSVMKGVESLGNLLPIAALGFSGVVALGNRDQTLSKASLASLEAGAAGLGLALISKYAVGRTRPDAGQGPGTLTPFSTQNSDSAFPSVHTTLAWAALTPYAKAYDAPWLYGVAALTNVARVSGRNHWLSDTVGGAFLGYAMGSLFWADRNTPSKNAPRLHIGPGMMGLEWETP